MILPARVFFFLASVFSVFFLFSSDLRAFTVSENKIFADGPYLFKMEVEVHGNGSLRKNPWRMASLKVKIKNDRASSQILNVKTIRAFIQPQVYQDLETKGFPIHPAQWVTKYYRLSKTKQPLVGEDGHIEIVFENFVIRFDPARKKFQGPFK